MHEIRLFAFQKRTKAASCAGPAERILTANGQRVMRGANPLQMPDHWPAARYHNGAPARIDDGLRHFQCAAFHPAAYQLWQ